MNLSELQNQAVSHINGPALVLAGPGSGKTTVITHRICNLIQNCHVNPTNILVITFTKAAAIEMKERFLTLIGNNSTAVTFGTFHAVYFTILKHSINYQSDCIIRAEQQQKIIREAAQHYELETDDESELVHAILSEISSVKNGRQELSEYQSRSCPENTFRGIYRIYEKQLKMMGWIDFDDMLIDCYNLLSKHPKILRAWQEKYQYILIDEFQDICQVQFDVIQLLAARHRNIFVVGDDDQSIYGFRGAKPEIMHCFEEAYSDAMHMELTENYRSAKSIVRASNVLVEHNQNRFVKNMYAMNSLTGKVEAWELQNIEDEYTFLIRKIKEMHEDGLRYNEIAVLFRINSIGNIVAGRFLMDDIPTDWQFQEKLIYDHWIARDIFAYIRAANGDYDRENMLRIINKPMRYITRSFLSQPVNLERLKDNYLLDNQMIERIGQLQYDLSLIRRMNPFAAVNYIRKAVGYDQYLENYASEHRVKLDSLFEVVDELTEDARKYDDCLQWFSEINTIKKKVELAKQETDMKKEGVHLQTMHGAKGLEFQAVFILDVNEGMIPYQKALLEDEMEEERRMFYVAMTRAKEYLCLLFTKERYNKKMTASRFIEELGTQSCEMHMLQPDNHVRNGHDIMSVHANYITAH